MVDETHRAVLFLLSEGRTFDEIFDRHPNLTPFDIALAAGDGLRALESEGAARPESREERIARVRVTHPRAFTAWDEEEDARLVLRWREGTRLVDLSRATGRPPGAVRMRLEKLLGPGWREARA